MNFKRILACLLALTLAVTLMVSCKGNEEESGTGTGTDTTADTTAGTTEESTADATDTVVRFDYFGTDLSTYVTVDKNLYNDTTVELGADYVIDESDLETYISTQRVQYRTALNDSASVTDQAIEFGDSAFIYYEGYLDGVAFEGGSNWNDEAPYELVIGSGSFIPGFEDGLIGLIPANTSKEEPFELHVTFPESYQATDLAGKAVVFNVFVDHIVEYELPEYNATFITDTLGFVAETDDVKSEFEAYMMEMMKAEMASYAKNEVLNVLWDNLLAEAEIHIYPEEEIEHYYNSYLEQYEYYMEYYTYFGYSFASLDEFVYAYLGLADGTDWRAETREACKIDVAQNLIFHMIAQQDGIIITDTDYQDSIQYYVDYYTSQGASYSASEIEAGLGSAFIKEHALFSKVNEILYTNCTVTYAEAE